MYSTAAGLGSSHGSLPTPERLTGSGEDGGSFSATVYVRGDEGPVYVASSLVSSGILMFPPALYCDGADRTLGVIRETLESKSRQSG